MTDTSEAEFSFLLWLLGAGVAVLAAHVSQGWVRRAQRGPTVWGQWRALLLAAGALGTGLCSAMVLAMQAQALGFPIGYQALAAAGLWLAAMLSGVFVVAWAAASLRWFNLLGSGVALAALAIAVQAGWVWAAGFRPGVAWRYDALGLAAAALAIGLALATWLAHAEASQTSQRGLLWRLGGAVLAGLTLMAGQELVMWAAGLPTQQGSVYQYEVPGLMLCVVCGVLVPLLLAAMELDLWLRRPRRSRASRNFNPQKRHRRRYRSRHL